MHAIIEQHTVSPVERIFKIVKLFTRAELVFEELKRKTHPPTEKLDPFLLINEEICCAVVISKGLYNVKQTSKINSITWHSTEYNIILALHKF